MTLRLVLCVSWICFLLFEFSAGLPAVKGYGYPYKGDLHNIGDDADDDALMSRASNPRDWQPSNQPASSAYTRYNKPLVTQRPASPIARQTLSVAPEVARPVNGDPRDWGLNNLGLDVVKPPSASLGVASTNRKPTSLAGGSTLYPGPNAYSKPSPSPSFHSWQPQSFGRDNTNHDAGSSGNILHVIYEEVFQYPSENTGPSSSNVGESSQANYMSRGSPTLSTRGHLFPSNMSNVGVQPVLPSGLGSIWSRFFGQMGHRPHHEKPLLRHLKPLALARQRLSEPGLLPPPSPRYRFKSKSSYRKGGAYFSQSRYSPLFPTSLPVTSKVKGQPAAPKAVKDRKKEPSSN